MTFPQTPIVELNLGGTWTAITGDVYQRDPIEITRGRTDEAGSTSPSVCRMTLDNRLGKYSPRNPMGAYYGTIGRNTPLRVSLPAPDPAYDAASTAGSGTGDLSWTHTPVGSPTGVTVMLMQYGSNADQVSAITYGGVEMPRVLSSASTVGATNARTYLYHLGEEIPTGAQTILVTTTGATLRGGGAVSFTGGTSTEVNTHTVVPNTSTNPTTTLAILNSRRCIILGMILSDFDAITSIAPGAGYTEVLETDMGTEIVAMERTSVQAPNTYNVNWTAAVSSAWLIQACAIQADYYRFYGEVASFPPEWDTSGNDAYAPIEAAGILRRLGQGDQPVQNGLKAFLLTTAPFGYWPLDDGPASTSGIPLGAIKSSTMGKFPPTGSDAPTTAFGVGDLGLTMPPGLQITTTGSYGYVRGDVAMATPATAKAIEFVFKATTLGVLVMQSREYNNLHWNVECRGDGTNDDFMLYITDETSGSPANVPIGDTTTHDAITDGREHHVRLQLTANGASTDYVLYVDGVSALSGTTAAASLAGSAWLQFQYTRAATDTPVAIGHVTAWRDNAPDIATTSTAAFGWTGETAGRRIERLCDEEGVPFVSSGDLDDTLAMGPLYGDYFFNQLSEIEATDLGMLYEPRSSLALGYRTRASLYNQTAAITLDYSAGKLSPPFKPIEDDRNTRNDVFAQRREGGSYQATATTGALSVSDPPAGVGRYKSEFPVNVETDAMLPEIAGWLLTLGTVDEPRFPAITIKLERTAFTADAALTLQALKTDIGDRLVISNADAANMYDDVAEIVVGIKEIIGKFEHEIQFSCAPGSPYLVAELDNTDTRVDPGEASTVNEAMTTTETDMDVASTAGTLWTTDGGQMPISIMVGGEEMSVTAIAGASSPQTFTVTRSVNGVVKTHSTGAVVRLKRPGVVSL